MTLPGKHVNRWAALAFLVLLGPALILTAGGDYCLAGGGSYVIGPEDVLSVKIFAGGQVRESLDLVVSAEGSINFPFLGEVKAEGRTVPELTAAVTETLNRDFFVEPQVIIRVLEHRSRVVYITGAIKNSGLFPLEGQMTLLELIAKAGGLTEDRGHYAHIIKGSAGEVKGKEELDALVHRDDAVQVDLRELMDQGRSDQNLELQPGDVVYIRPSRFSAGSSYKVYVLGKVKKPGAYDYQDGLTALDACVLAGGFDNYSAPNRTKVTRRLQNGNTETIQINLNQVKEGRTKDLPLKPGDRVYVPKSWL